MPFDFKKYDEKCASLDGDALQREWEHYTRLISGAATSTAVSGVAIPFTLGVSTIGVGLAAPAIHNARKKREIIERHLQRQGRTHVTRKRDVLTAGAISGTVGVVTLGLAPVGAEAICNHAASHGVAYIAENEIGVHIATHLALDATAVAAEETHMHSMKEKQSWRAYAQAVKEGKNPPLPNSDLKIPTTTITQVNDIQLNGQSVVSETKPSIHVVPPLELDASTDTALVYFPPPPGQTDLKVSSPLHRRHSTSTLSLNAQEQQNEPSKPLAGNHLIVGTATAISAPMVGGQSYAIQIDSKRPDLPPRPYSTIGGEALFTKPGDTLSVVDDTSQQILVLPPPPYPGPPENLTVQQPQIPFQRPRAHSSTSLNAALRNDTYPPYQPHDYNASNLPYPPPLPPSAPVPPLSPLYPSYTSTSPGANSSTKLLSPTTSNSPTQPRYTQPQSPSNQYAYSAPYNPSTYASPQSHQQQQNFHAPAQMVYSPQEITQPINDYKTPSLYQYQPHSPATMSSPQNVNVNMNMHTSYPNTNSAPTQYTSPTTRPYNSYFPTAENARQVPYFPPPPTY